MYRIVLYRVSYISIVAYATLPAFRSFHPVSLIFCYICILYSSILLLVPLIVAHRIVEEDRKRAAEGKEPIDRSKPKRKPTNEPKTYYLGVDVL